MQLEDETEFGFKFKYKKEIGFIQLDLHGNLDLEMIRWN